MYHHFSNTLFTVRTTITTKNHRLYQYRNNNMYQYCINCTTTFKRWRCTLLLRNTFTTTTMNYNNIRSSLSTNISNKNNTTTRCSSSNDLSSLIDPADIITSNETTTIKNNFCNINDDDAGIENILNVTTPPSTTTRTTTTLSTNTFGTRNQSFLQHQQKQQELSSVSKQQLEQNKQYTQLLRQLSFVTMLRDCAPYIANHCNTIAIYHIPNNLFHYNNHNSNRYNNNKISSSSLSSNNIGKDSSIVIRNLMDDIALTWLLDIKIIIIIGGRGSYHYYNSPIISIQQQQDQQQQLYDRNVSDDNSLDTITLLKHGLNRTTFDMLHHIQEDAGYVRFEIERQLARSLRLHGSNSRSSSSKSNNTTNKNNNNSTISRISTATTMESFDGNVISGNFYTAQPFGIINDIDYQYTGYVRNVEIDKIHQLHLSRDICVLSSIGVSPSGEIFYINSEAFAAIVAGTMNASKVVYFTEQEICLRHKINGNKIEQLKLQESLNLLHYYGINMHTKGYITLSDDIEQYERRKSLTSETMDMLIKIGWSTTAIQYGVNRTHIIQPNDGALIQELYTSDGSGLLISK